MRLAGTLKIYPPKGPIAKHLKEGMMGKVSAHILQVAVASSSPHTFLAVRHTSEACHLASWIHSAQEDWLELVHARVDEKQAGVAARPHGSGRHQAVAMAVPKEAQEGVPHGRGLGWRGLG